VALRLWLGFPKSLDISKAIDKKLGAEREVVEVRKRSGNPVNTFGGGTLNHRPYQDRQREQYGHLVDIITAPATPEAQQWDGWGTALKPANEPILLARKPISEKTIAENVLKWGTGGLNIDGCRIPMLVGEDTRRNSRGGENGLAGSNTFKIRERRADEKPLPSGRFPANVILDEEAGKLLDKQSGISKGSSKPRKNKETGRICYGDYKTIVTQNDTWGDSGGASRFFYCVKASRSERTHGGKVENKHPTVKPIKLMRYLCRLITPPGGTVLDPFAGSGTTLLAAVQEDFSCIGIEKEPDYCEIIRKRMAELQPALPLVR